MNAPALPLRMKSFHNNLLQSPEEILTAGACQLVSQRRRSGRRRKDEKEDVPSAHSRSHSHSAGFPYYCCHGERKQGEQIVPGSDEDAGTWLSGSILRGLIPHSIFEVC